MKGKKVTTKEFKRKLESKNSKVIVIGEYINYRTKIRCKCPICGNEWDGNPLTLMGGSGCPICAHKHSRNTGKKKTTEEFIQEARKLYGEKYDYSNVVYESNKTPILIHCNIHNLDFYQIPQNHLRGYCGCLECSKEKNNYNRKKTTKDFINEAIQVHGNLYDYSKTEYVNGTTPVCIICSKHGKFWQIPNSHLGGAGCPKCNGGVKISKEEFIEKALKIHGKRYDYSKVEYIDSITKVCIICPEHGEFWQRPSDHLNKKAGCPKCCKSHGELTIENYLIKNNIKYIDLYPVEIDKTINSSGKGTIDFYLPDYNCFIEFNGKLHYKPIKLFGGQLVFEHLQLRDEYIRNYCKNKNITLIEIEYTTSEDKIQNQIKEFLDRYE